MLPIVDYGSIAIVVPQITAVGSVVNEEGKPGFEVFLSGMEDPVIVGFDSEDEATESREELIAIIAQYHYVKEFGPDFEFSDLLGNKEKGEDDDDVNEH